MTNIQSSLNYFYEKYLKLLKEDENLYLSVVVYGIGVSLLSLAIPVSIQTLVNKIAFVMLYQPVVVLSLVLLVFLLCSAILSALQDYVTEQFEQKFYFRMTREISLRILNSRIQFFEEENQSNIVNKYFDIMNVQKSFSFILVSGSFVIMQMLAGLLLLAFYHPYFLLFDFVLLYLIYLVWTYFNKSSLETAIEQSKAKYKVATWMEEMATHSRLFHKQTPRKFALKKSAQYIDNFISKRKKHFFLVFFQSNIFLFLYALLSAFVLALGGWLVIKEQLTLGQLVAAEIVVASILISISKFGKYLEKFYELSASLAKIEEFFNIPQLNLEKFTEAETDKYDLVFEEVAVKDQENEILINLKFEFNKKYFISYKYNSLKNALTEILSLKKLEYGGQVTFGGQDLNKISPWFSMEKIYVVDEPRFFDGTLIENLTFKKNITDEKVMEVLNMLGLKEVVLRQENKLETNLYFFGHPFSRTQLIRFEIARALLCDCKVLVLTKTFDELDEKRYESTLKALLELEHLTVIYLSRRLRDKYPFDHYIKMDSKECHVSNIYKEA